MKLAQHQQSMQMTGELRNVPWAVRSSAPAKLRFGR
jgi:hypothetical protein